MEFVTLREALNAIAARVPVPKVSEFAEEAKTSEAAGLLHQTFNNVLEGRPRWVERNKISGKPIFNDTAVYPEAMALLERAAGYHNRCTDNRNNHISSCLRAGLDPRWVPIGFDLADMEYPRDKFFRPDSIGFDRAELMAFLDKTQIDNDLTPKDATPSPAPVATDEIAFDMVATRQELIDVFGKFTGMDRTWFDNLNTSPKLKAARKYAGRGGRHSAEPLFCPYEVMQWLTDPKRKKGKPLSDTTAWRLLKGSFGKVYNLHSIGDPNAD